MPIPQKTLCHIVIALCHLVLSVGVEAQLELSNFYIEANSLLDCTTMLGIEAEWLQLWEFLCRDVKFRLFSLHATY